MAPPGTADGRRGPDRLPVRPALHARDRAVAGRSAGRGAARPIGQHGPAGWQPGRSTGHDRGAGDPGSGRPGDATGGRHLRPRRSIPSPRPTDLEQDRDPSRRPPARTTAPRWPGRATSCVRSRKATKELHILTDLQRSGLDRGEAVSLPADVEVHLARLRPRVSQERRRDGRHDRPRRPPARRVGHRHRDRAQRLTPADLPSVPSGSTSRRATRSATWSGTSTWRAARPRAWRSRSSELAEGHLARARRGVRRR